MKIADARALADQLIDVVFTVAGKTVCARSIGYSFEWMNSSRILGSCNYTTKKICLSEEYVLNNSVELVKDTILHELAHAFSYHIYGYLGTGHNRFWKSVCVQIGARPERGKSTSDGLVTTGPWCLVHKETGEIYSRWKKRPHSIEKNIDRVYVKNQIHTRGKLKLVYAA